MIQFDSVYFQYGKKEILKGLSFTAEPGRCTVLAGPNGIGKSTALAIASGALKAGKGIVTTEGAVGYAPQEPTLFQDMTVKDNLRFFSALKKVPVPDEFFIPISVVMKKKISALSGGMQKRVSLICSDIGSPENLLFDEPCIGLDIAAQEMLFKKIAEWKKEGRTLVYAGHNPQEIASVCDRLVLLHKDRYQVLEKDEIDDFEKVLSQWIHF